MYRSLNLNMHVPEQIKQTPACNVAMADGICIINNSYHETFFMKFSAVLSAIRAYNKGANIEKVRVCFACKCNAPTPVIVKDTPFWCCGQNEGGCVALHGRVRRLCREPCTTTLEKRFVRGRIFQTIAVEAADLAGGRPPCGIDPRPSFGTIQQVGHGGEGSSSAAFYLLSSLALQLSFRGSFDRAGDKVQTY